MFQMPFNSFQTRKSVFFGQKNLKNTKKTHFQGLFMKSNIFFMICNILSGFCKLSEVFQTDVAPLTGIGLLKT